MIVAGADGIKMMELVWVWAGSLHSCLPSEVRGSRICALFLCQLRTHLTCKGVPKILYCTHIVEEKNRRLINSFREKICKGIQMRRMSCLPKRCINFVLQYVISVLIFASGFYRMLDWSSSIAWFLAAPMLNVAKYIFPQIYVSLKQLAKPFSAQRRSWLICWSILIC